MEYKHNPPTLHELREAREPVKHAHRVAKAEFTHLEKFALQVTRGVGTIGFFFLLLLWTVGWLVWNIWGPANMHFDPAPAFVIWLIFSNILQLTLLPLIMVGQNLESKFAEKRAEEDYRINKKAEHEVEVVIAHLENQNEMLLELMKKIDKR